MVLNLLAERRQGGLNRLAQALSHANLSSLNSEQADLPRPSVGLQDGREAKYIPDPPAVCCRRVSRRSGDRFRADPMQCAGWSIRTHSIYQDSCIHAVEQLDQLQTGSLHGSDSDVGPPGGLWVD